MLLKTLLIVMVGLLNGLTIEDLSRFPKEIDFEKSIQNLDRPKLSTPLDGCGVTDNSFSKLFGGHTSKVNSWPWLALLGYTDVNGAFSFQCGGSLITKRHVLTAAQCIHFDLTTIRLGEHDLETNSESKHIDVPIINIITHPNYDERNSNNDITILVLGYDIEFTKAITPICLPITESVKNTNYTGYHPLISGWGFMNNNNPNSRHILQEFQIKIRPNEECAGHFSQHFPTDIFCAGSGYLDACQIDKGGPLMLPILSSDKNNFNFYLIGILSKGMSCERQTTIPNVFIKVSSFMDWIQEQVAKTL